MSQDTVTTPTETESSADQAAEDQFEELLETLAADDAEGTSTDAASSPDADYADQGFDGSFTDTPDGGDEGAQEAGLEQMLDSLGSDSDDDFGNPDANIGDGNPFAQSVGNLAVDPSDVTTPVWSDKDAKRAHAYPAARQIVNATIIAENVVDDDGVLHGVVTLTLADKSTVEFGITPNSLGDLIEVLISMGAVNCFDYAG